MRQKVARWVIVSALALIPICLLLCFGWRFLAARALMGELASIRTDGDPLSLEDLQRPEPEIAEGDDAAVLYESAISGLQEPDGAELDELLELYRARAAKWPGEPIEPGGRARAGRLLKQNASALQLLDRAASLPECWPEVRITEANDLERVEAVRSLAELSLLRITDAALRGDGDAAADTTVATLRLLRICDRAPLVYFMVGTGLRYVVCSHVPLVLESAPTDAALARLEMAVRELDRPGSLTESLRTERVFVLLRLRNIVEGVHTMTWPGTPIYGEWPRPGWLARPRERNRVTTFLRDFRGVLHATRTPWPGVRKTVKAVQIESVFSKPLHAMVTSTLDSLGALLGVARSARMAILVERHRLANGRRPESIEEVLLESARSVPMDPFSGEALIFRQVEESYVIYSIGGNGNDDGGAVETEDRLDIGVRVRLGKDSP